MKKIYTYQQLFLLFLLVSVSVFTSCKKKNNDPAPATPIATLGLYEYASGVNKRIFIVVSKVGTKDTTFVGAFDTGSTGMTMDAHGLIPDAMITSSGITFTGDSVVTNGITIKGRQLIMAYGDNISSTKEYGYLAYAAIKLGDSRGQITTKRIPFFLYYKIVDQTGYVYQAHSSDVFGVGPGTSYASTLIASPLSYFDIPSGVTNGFKLATLTSGGFNSTGTYMAGLLTIGLIPSDLTSSGFIMHPLTYSSSGGYSANISATITYSGKTIDGQILFDTGTPSVTVIEDKTASAIGNLPANTLVSIKTNMGFTYSYYTASTANLTEIQNPNNTGDYRTIFSLDFFISNEYLTDYTNHQIGLKNN
ncbi:hypothetical protein BDD43_2610 [Mucilaginibacter gracilis]|uniref:Peptidase A1 domain-containing protein n=1 Tax=Mucilaginibacter gracilis TaxID=423350 RepID=A0A495J0D4_9SPHI|nr:hypothetical protein [Mucilaginibacter gracilis]RKR82430.1 hypothetical protein BDD43_2610 [Mucilaginibacter gracilis]